ncbi:hypothetical protein ABVK25_006751 [Lepraria finkii]|uniref:DUF7730 domain-containing protein n=1 Tax=Lepraria finkii TaxID=1340010 RepID=A0ABR4B5H2_9LECA
MAPPRLAMQVNLQIDQEPISPPLRSEPLCFTPVQIQSDSSSDSDSEPSSNGSPELQSCLSILATCCQILFEAYSIYYRHNTFNFSRGKPLRGFLKSICPARRHEIVSIRCDFPLNSNYPFKA